MKEIITKPVFKNLITESFENAIYLIDENVFKHHQNLFIQTKYILIYSGENSKTLKSFNAIIKSLINYNANRNTILIGVGGGVVTDLTGFVASVFMRGISFGFVPTTLLAMVDASIGGKNGVNIGLHKNYIGIINQPKFIINDIRFLKTLPHDEWVNGFAEIIKHACIYDKNLFKKLESNHLNIYKNDLHQLKWLIKKSSKIKCNIVELDVQEKGQRMILNFGHTFGHAIETVYKISHGKAVSIGIVFAARLSKIYFNFSDSNRLINLLKQYELPVSLEKLQKPKLISLMLTDKKKINSEVNFIFIEKIGKVLVKSINKEELKNAINEF